MTTAAERDQAARYDRVIRGVDVGIRDLDLDAFADGVLAHRAGWPFHDNPHRDLLLAGLSWRMGWNERALATRD
jgi:hypothetical protein